MLHRKAVSALFLAALSGAASSASAGVIATWTFETSIPVTAGPHAAEVGLGSALGGTGGTYTSPAGNGSAHSFSSNGWDVGDFYQYSVAADPTESEYHINWDQTGSGTGPRDFKLQYSADGGAFTDIVPSYVVLLNGTPPPAWNSTTSNPANSYTATLTGITGVSSLVFRFIDTSATSISGGAVGTGGTDRMDNVSIISGPVPEPASLALLSAPALLLRRRKTA